MRHAYTGLNLLTANTGSDQSTVDDGLSPSKGDKEGKSEVGHIFRGREEAIMNK